MLNNVRKITRSKVTNLCKNQLLIASATVVIIHTRFFPGFSRLARGIIYFVISRVNVTTKLN